MNIGMVCFPTYGGSGVVATELGMALAQKGHKVHFMSYSQPFRLNRLYDNLFFHEFNVNDYPLFDYQPYESVLASKIVDVAVYEHLDVLHVHYAIPHASVAYTAQQILKSKKIKLPYITTLHGTDITLVGRDPAFEPVIRFSLNQSNAITAVSESLKKDTLKTFKIDNAIQVIPNFITLSEFLPQPQLNKTKELVIAHISNFRKVKRIEDVIHVFNRVKDQIPCRLIIAGDGPEKSVMERLVRDLNIQSQVHFVGMVADPKSVLQAADIFLLPSETESFGLSALEALAMGVPVISSNSGGLPEVNKHGISGWLYNVGDIEGMASGILTLWESPKTLTAFKTGAKQTAARYDISVVLPQYEALYKQIISK